MAEIYNSTYAKKQSAGMVTGSYHLADNPALYEVQRNNNFEFIVTGLSALRNVAGGTEQLPHAEETLRLSVKEGFVPHFTQEAITIRRGNSVVKYAGVPTFNDGSLVLNDYIGADTKAVLMAWQRLSYDVTSENLGVSANYKKEASLIEYSPDFKKVREWKLQGCWISGLSEGAYDQEDGGKRQITATIQYDKAMPV